MSQTPASTLPRTRHRVGSLLAAGLVAGAVGSALLAAPAHAATVTPTVTGGSALGVGATAWPFFTVTGTGFQAGATIAFTATGSILAAGAASSEITVDAGTTPTVSADGKTITAQVTLAASAAAGDKLDVTVTNPGGTAVSCYVGGLTNPVDSGCVTIDAAPTKLTFPKGVGVGAVDHPTAFTATGLQPGPAVLLPKSGIGVTSKAFLITSGDTGESPLVSVAAAATPGTAYGVTLVNGDGGRETVSNFAIDSPPSITALSNTGAVAGTEQYENITGTGFSTPTVTFLGKSYSPLADNTTATKLSNLDLGLVPAAQPGGAFPVAVINDDGGTATSNVSVRGVPQAPSVVNVTDVADGTATVFWLPVTGAGTNNSTIDGYEVSTVPDTGPHYVKANQPLSYTLTNLADGTAYTANVAAVTTDNLYGATASSPSFTPVATVVPPAPTPQIVFKASRTALNFADGVVFSGSVTLNGVPDSNDLVYLQSIDGKVRTDTGDTVTTDANGNFTFAKQIPAYSMTWGVRVGTSTAGAVKVTVTQYLPKPTVVINKAKRTVTITGFATPSTSAYSKATVQLFKVTKTGHRVGSITKSHLTKTASKRGYDLKVNSFTLKATLKKGTYVVAVAVLGTPTNAPVQSAPITIKIA